MKTPDVSMIDIMHVKHINNSFFFLQNSWYLVRVQTCYFHIYLDLFAVFVFKIGA